MKIPRPLRLLPFLVLTAWAEEKRGDQPDAKPRSPQEQRALFHVPPGFEVQLVAAEPDIQKPLNLNFDAAGRLWATGSELYPWAAQTDANGNPIPGFQKMYQDAANAFAKGKAPEPSPVGRDTVRILSDFAPDGRARRIATFADGLNIPTGVQPLPRPPGAKGDRAIVYSIPHIWLMTDTDGDGNAERKDPLYEGFGFVDTHGMSSNYIYWIDGWIYGCHGFRNHSEVRDRQGKVTVFDSGNTYRFKPDGSAIEYYTHGQTNPFGLAFDPLGNLFSADSHSKPVYMLLRGGYYEGIGKQHDGLGFAPRITDDDHGSSAIAGIAFYADDKFPEEFRGNLFNGNPVTRKINRDRLEWHGSTPKAIRMPDLLSCDDPWFRPVQVKLGPDGALYIADFYNPIIGHYEVPLTDPRRDHAHGRIWRVVWRGENASVSRERGGASGSTRASPVVAGASPGTSTPPASHALSEKEPSFLAPAPPHSVAALSSAAPTPAPAAPTLPLAASTLSLAAPTLPPAAPTLPLAASTLSLAAPTLPPAAPTLPPEAPTLPPAAAASVNFADAGPETVAESLETSRETEETPVAVPTIADENAKAANDSPKSPEGAPKTANPAPKPAKDSPKTPKTITAPPAASEGTRVSPTTGGLTPLPDLTQLDAAGLIEKLASPSLEIRRLATHELVDRLGSDAFAPIRQMLIPDGTAHDPDTKDPAKFATPFWENTGAVARAHALGVLARLGALPADIFRVALKSPEAPFRSAALHLLADREPGAADDADLLRALTEPDAALRRIAAKALAQHPHADHLAPLLGAWAATPADDPELLYALRAALRDQLLAPIDFASMSQSARLSAPFLNHDGARLFRSGVAAEAERLAAQDPAQAQRLAEVSLAVPTPEAAHFLLAHLERTKFAAPRTGDFLKHALLHVPAERLPQVAALVTRLDAAPASAALPLVQRLALADALGEASRQRGLKLPEALATWTQRIMFDALTSPDEAVLKRAIETVRESKLPAKLAPLSKLAADPNRPGPLRASALEALANLDAATPAFIAALHDTSSLTLRKKAAELLPAKAGADQGALAASLPTAPWELAVTIAGALAKSDAGAGALLDLVDAGQASAALLRHKAVTAALDKRPPPLRERAAALTKDLPPEDTRLDGVIAQRVEAFRAGPAVAARGARVFQQQCAVCHRFRGDGGNVGPNLDGMSARGPHRLLEDILDPNRNVDPAFRQTVIETRDGRVVMGANLRTHGTVLTLTDAAGKDVTVLSGDIKTQTASKLSLMPPVFETQLSPGDLNDLLAYLLTPAPAP